MSLSLLLLAAMISKLVVRYMDFATAGVTMTAIVGHQMMYGPLLSKVQETVQMYR